MIGTENSRRLCEQVASATGGVCFLGFSRGKDSIAAWLWLRTFFDRIIPFHLDAVPGLSFVERSLAYYESWFGVSIQRFVSGGLLRAIERMIYQLPGAENEIDSSGLVEYDTHDVVRFLRREMNLPRAWCAFGINASDSIDRRIYVNKYQGRIESHRSFYPCFDWPKKQILEMVRKVGVKLPEDYLLNNRTFAGTPEYRYVAKMKELFPADYERVRLTFPLVDAVFARQAFKTMRLSGTENIPGIPLTGIDSTGDTLPKTHAKKSGAKSQPAEAASPGRKGRQSKTSTTATETPVGSSR